MKTSKEISMTNLTSCLQGTPLISFDGAEQQASVLNYNLPASTTFTVRVFIPVDVPDSFWNEDAKSLQDNSPYIDLPSHINVPSEEQDKSNSRIKDAQKGIKLTLPDLVNTRYPWEVNNPNPPWEVNQPGSPEWIAKARLAEAGVREIGASHPSLELLVGLPIVADLQGEIMSSEAFAESSITTRSLKLGDTLK
jgi:hypothetical protein